MVECARLLDDHSSWSQGSSEHLLGTTVNRGIVGYYPSVDIRLLFHAATVRMHDHSKIIKPICHGAEFQVIVPDTWTADYLVSNWPAGSTIKYRLLN